MNPALAPVVIGILAGIAIVASALAGAVIYKIWIETRPAGSIVVTGGSAPFASDTAITGKGLSVSPATNAPRAKRRTVYLDATHEDEVERRKKEAREEQA